MTDNVGDVRKWTSQRIVTGFLVEEERHDDHLPPPESIYLTPYGSRLIGRPMLVRIKNLERIVSFFCVYLERMMNRSTTRPPFA